MFGKKRIGGRVTAIAITLVLVLVVASVTYAAEVTGIDTNDGSVDGNWSSVPVLLTDGTTEADNYDIVEAWVAHNAGQSAFFFRVNLAGQLPSDFDSLEARLDCSSPSNISFQDAEDVVVIYTLDTLLDGGEETVECQGSDYINCDRKATNTSDTNDDSLAEVIAGTPYNYEWQADVTTGDADWSSCLGTIQVQFATVDIYGDLQDVTQWATYPPSNPTAVTLATFGATASDGRVYLDWETSSEVNIVGFNLYRAETVDGEQILVNDSLILSQPAGGAAGALYQYEDMAIQPGSSYWYWLETVDVQDGRTLHGPASVQVPFLASFHLYLPLTQK